MNWSYDNISFVNDMLTRIEETVKVLLLRQREPDVKQQKSISLERLLLPWKPSQGHNDDIRRMTTISIVYHMTNAMGDISFEFRRRRNWLTSDPISRAVLWCLLLIFLNSFRWASEFTLKFVTTWPAWQPGPSALFSNLLRRASILSCTRGPVHWVLCYYSTSTIVLYWSTLQQKRRYQSSGVYYFLRLHAIHSTYL